MPVGVAQGPPSGGYNLASNENAWGPSPRAAAAMRDDVARLHRYPVQEYLSLRTALAASIGSSCDEILLAAGSEQLITVLHAAYAGRGDEVLGTRLGFALFRIAATMGGASPVLVPERGWDTDVDRVLDAVTPRTTIVALASPNNPTGVVVPASEIRRLREGLAEHVVLIVDLAYAEFCDAHSTAEIHRLAQEREDTVVLRTFSKAYGLAAARVGWAHGAAALLEPCRRLLAPFRVGAGAARAATAALGDGAWLRDTVAAAVEQRSRLTAALVSIGLEVVPSQTNFVLVRFDDAQHAASAIDHCRRAGVSIRLLGMYGRPDCVRITIGRQPQCDAVAAALRQCSEDPR